MKIRFGVLLLIPPFLGSSSLRFELLPPLLLSILPRHACVTDISAIFHHLKQEARSVALVKVVFVGAVLFEGFRVKELIIVDFDKLGGQREHVSCFYVIEVFVVDGVVRRKQDEGLGDCEKVGRTLNGSCLVDGMLCVHESGLSSLQLKE